MKTDTAINTNINTCSVKALIQASIRDGKQIQSSEQHLIQSVLKADTKPPAFNTPKSNTNDRIRQEFTGQKTSNFTLQKERPAWLDEGVPADAVIVFPSRVHEPDLQGFDCPSSSLPYHLQIFGYWGYGLTLDKLGPALVTKPQSSPNREHVKFWLYHCWDEIKADYLAWTQAQDKRRNHA